MGARLVADAPAVAVAYPWGALGHVVDVGGGNASLLIAILRAHGDLRGTVIDLAGPVARAEQAIASAGLGHRAGAQVGSFFDSLSLPPGGVNPIRPAASKSWAETIALQEGSSSWRSTQWARCISPAR